MVSGSWEKVVCSTIFSPKVTLKIETDVVVVVVFAKQQQKNDDLR